MALLLLSAIACTPSPSPCPPDTREDDDRADRVHELLVSADPAEAKLDLPKPVCFAGSGEAALTPTAIVLQAAASDPESAARLGHLLTHARGLPPWPKKGGAPCEERLAQARAAETAGLAKENAIRTALGLTALPPESLDDVMAGYAAQCAAGR